MNWIADDYTCYDCGEIYYLAEDRTADYLQFEREYYISDVLSELGNCWKRLLSVPDIEHILPFRAWLKTYVDECMPQINRFISEIEAMFEESEQLTEEDLNARQRAYRAYRARLNKLIAKLDVAKELYNIRREDPDFYNSKE